MTQDNQTNRPDMVHDVLAYNAQNIGVWDTESDSIAWQGTQDFFAGEACPSEGIAFRKAISAADLPRVIEAISHAQDGVVKPAFHIVLRSGTQVSIHFFPVQKSGQLNFVMQHVGETDYAHDSEDKTLLTRPALCEAVEAITLNDRNDPSPAYILTVGLDRISLLNEAYGASAVDHMIDEAGFRLRSLLPTGTDVARISGDIFGVLLKDMPLHRAESMAVGLLKTFVAQPFHTPHGQVRISLSIGGLGLHGECMRGGDALSKAEIALSRAKTMGGGCFHAYHDGLQNTIETRALLGRGFDFLEASDDSRLVLAFQPVVHSNNGEVAFYESLIRMVDKKGRMVPAGEFIPVLEQLGFARMADRFTLKKAVKELEAYPDIHLSVNVSNWSLNDPQWLRCAAFLLQGKPDIASRLIVEITESVAMTSLKKARSVIQALQSLGCAVALDDFGAGYTSFKQIKDLNVDIIKIDQHFVRHIDQDENTLFIQALQSLANGMNIQTVGEGAETEREMKMLKKIGLTYIQGYACGHPSTERVWLPKKHSERQTA